MIESDDFRDHFLGYNIVDCVVHTRNTFYFIADQDRPVDGEPVDDEKRLVKIEIDGDGKPGIKHVLINGFDWPIHCEIKYPEERVAVFDIGSTGYIAGTGIEKEIEPSHAGGPLRGAVTRLKTYGQDLYVSSSSRDLLVRTDKEKWERIGPELDSKIGGETGFDDFDAFAMDDLYAVGGDTDVYRFNGKSWEKKEFPSRHGLSAVCCAGDGFVYIADGFGSIYRGRDNDWTLIHKGEEVLPYRDLVWFENRVWATSDYRVHTIFDGQFEEHGASSDAKIYSGNMSVRDDTLLVAGFGGAGYCHNGQWHELFIADHLRQ